MKLLLWLASLFLSQASYFIQAEKMINVLQFQPEGIPSMHSSSVKFLKPDKDREFITSFSVCVWFNVNFFKGYHYHSIFSYAVSEKNNNEMNLAIGVRRMNLVTATTYSTEIRQQLFWPNIWNHVCFVTNATKVYINGRPESTSVIGDYKIYLNGSFVLGQETDDVNGKFVALQSFSGKISDLHLFSRDLTEDEVLLMASCDDNSPSGDIIDWSTDKWNSTEEVKEMKVPKRSLCEGSKKNQFRTFAEVKTHKEASKMCRQMSRDVIYAPRSSEENDELYSQTEHLIDNCKAKLHATGYFWIGLKYNEENWTYEDTYTNYTNFGLNSKGKNSDCVTMVTSSNTGGWNDVGCDKLLMCFACREPEPVTFRLRGLCVGRNIGAFFLANKEFDSDKNVYSFRSFTQYEITMDITTWILRDVWVNKIIASYQPIGNLENMYPIGTHYWEIKNNSYFNCMDDFSKNLTKRIMTFSTCADDEFTCTDGSCISLLYRCNLRQDCPDAFDELNCDKLEPVTEYLHTSPPPHEDNMFEPLRVNVSLVVNSISRIDYVNMQVNLDMTLRMQWFDLRLKYGRLSPVTSLNFVNATKVWMPLVDFLEADFAAIHKSPVRVRVVRSDAEKDNLARPLRDEIFLGSKNPLMLEQRFKSQFSCPMDLTNFPFDIQTCWVNMKEDHQSSLVIWNKINVSYVGQTLMTEFRVGKLTAQLRNDKDDSIIVFRIQLFRQYSYYLSSAYFPSMLLIVISYFSLFCKAKNHDLRVMMTITVLVVLYTLYQQLASGLPKTYYSKAIDIWFKFSLFIIFAEVVFHVTLELHIPSLEIYMRRLEEVYWNRTFDEKKSNYKSFCLFISRFVFLLLFIAFCVPYCTLIIFEYNRMMNSVLDEEYQMT